MSKFSIEILTDKNISVELNCKNCENKFITEIDSNFKHQNNSEFQYDILYCHYCEQPYEYKSIKDGSYLNLRFDEAGLDGCLKFSQKLDKQELEELNPAKSFRFYQLQIQRLERLVELKTGEHIVDQTLFRLIYSGVITSLETYLSEVFSYVVFYSSDTLETFVSNYEPFKKEKISLNEIIKKYNNLEFRIKDDLDNFIYHNISKLIPIFNIFDFRLEEFTQIKLIGKYVKKRHNLVHKSGLINKESFEEITEKEVQSLILNVNLFVDYIADKYTNKCFLPFEDELPF